MSVQIRYRCDYIVHISNNITLFSLNIFHPQLIESVNADPTDTQGHLYI